MAPIAAPTSDTLFHRKRISQYVSLPAASLTSALPAISASVFSPLLLTYYPPVRGVVLAYTDVTLSSSAPSPSPTAHKKRKHTSSHRHRKEREEEAQHHSDSEPEPQPQPQSQNGTTILATQIDEYTSPFLWATATFLVWRPRQNARINATLTHQSSTHMTLSYLNLFAVTVLRAHMPPEWRWHEEAAGKKKKGWDGRIEDAGGWWVDGDGARVGADGAKEVEVWIREWDARPAGGGKGRGFLKIEGSLVAGEGARAREEVRVD